MNRVLVTNIVEQGSIQKLFLYIFCIVCYHPSTDLFFSHFKQLPNIECIQEECIQEEEKMSDYLTQHLLCTQAKR